MSEIDDGFLLISKEFKKYKKEKLDEYREKGIIIDTASHEAHWFKVFVMGKLAILSGLETKAEKKKVETKEKGDKKDVKKSTARKRKTRKRTDGSQLELGVQG